jgi:hypothetical protein
MNENMIPHRNTPDGELAHAALPGDAADFAIRCGEPDNQAMAKRIAKRLVSPWPHEGRISLFVLSGCRAKPQAPALPYTRKIKNKYGVTFHRKDIGAAEQWAATALLAGYVVFNNTGCGHGLTSGDYIDDLWAAGVSVSDRKWKRLAYGWEGQAAAKPV